MEERQHSMGWWGAGEGLCPPGAWQRACPEINEFEKMLADYGTVIIKSWVQTDKDDHLRRFKAHEETAHKRWKISGEDWWNRGEYEMGEKCVPAERKPILGVKYANG